MHRMNSRWGVMMSALVLLAGLAVTSEASAQQATRKPVTHKGTAKRSLVKKSAPVESKQDLAASSPLPAAKQDAIPVTKQPDAPVTKQPDAFSGGSAAAPEPPAGKAPGAADLSGGPVKLRGKPAEKPAPAPPAKPKTSNERFAKPSPTTGTAVEAGASTAATQSAGPVNRVTDARLRPGTTTGAAKPKPKVPVGTTAKTGGPTGSGTTSGAPKGGGTATVATGSGASQPNDGTRTAAPGGGTEQRPSDPVPPPPPETKSSGAVATSALPTEPVGVKQQGGDAVVSEGKSGADTADASPSGSTREGKAVDEASKSDGPTDLDAQDFLVESKAPAPKPALARFRALTWCATNPEAAPHMTSFIWCGLPGGWVMSDPVRVAAELKNRPAGQRVLFFWDMLHNLADHPLDRIQRADGLMTDVRSPFMDNGIAVTRDIVTDFLQRLKAAGGEIDVLVLDYERVFFWDPAYKALVNDPRWPRLAAELGYEDLERQWDGRWVRWNEVMGRYFDDAIHRSTVEPLWSIFPNAKFVNYEAFTCLPDAPTMHVSGNAYLRQSVVDSSGSRIGLGSHDSFPFYGFIFPCTATARFDGVNEVGGDPFSVLRLEIHRLRAMRHSNDRPQMAWVSPKGYDVLQSDPQLAGVQQVMRLSPYWDELALQLGMNGSETFLYWNPEPYRADQDASVFNRIEDQRTLNGVLAELNEKLGQDSGGSVYYVQPGFDDRIIATGRDVGDRVVWRLSFAPGVDSVRVFFTDNSSLVIRRETDRPGAWFSHPKSKVMVFDADRSAPVFEELAALTPPTP